MRIPDQSTFDPPAATPRLDTDRAAEVLGLKPTRLRQWRRRGFGPPYVKLGRSVFYDRRDLEAWVRKCVRNA